VELWVLFFELLDCLLVNNINLKAFIIVGRVFHYFEDVECHFIVLHMKSQFFVLTSIKVLPVVRKHWPKIRGTFLSSSMFNIMKSSGK